MGIRVRQAYAILLFFFILLEGCSFPGSPSGADGKTPLVVFAAGSLIIPFHDLEEAFEENNPGIDVQAQYHGSVQVMRHATELHELIDVVATADASLIPMLMYALDDPDSGLPFADWHIRFATNHLAVAYRPESKYADEINGSNWYSLLSLPDIKVGIPDPRFDALGYRTLMAYALAGPFYNDPTIFVDMFSGDFNYPLGIFMDGALTTITVPEIIETTAGSPLVIRGSSIALIALLESGDLDYAFEYESVIRQHGLEMVSLPGQVDLGEEEFSLEYQSVQVNLDFQRFATVKPEFRGERIGYGITIPSNAPHPEEAAMFISFLLSPEGRAIMESQFHPVFNPPACDGFSSMPELLQPYCSPEGEQ